MSKNFIKQLLKNEKKLIKINKLKQTNLSTYKLIKETYVSNLVNVIKNDKELMSYFNEADLIKCNNAGCSKVKTDMVNVINTIRPEYINEINQKI